MVWYVPPLSPVTGYAASRRNTNADPDDVFGAIDELRIPIEYMASMFTAGDPAPVREALRRLAGMREAMRIATLAGTSEPDADAATRAGMSTNDLKDMYRLLAIGDYHDRYVIPKGHAEVGTTPIGDQGTCGLDFAGGPGSCAVGTDTDRDASRQPSPGQSAPTTTRSIIPLGMLKRRTKSG
jgi:nitrate reductase beta subunit